MQINEIIEFWERASEEQRHELANKMSNMNIQNRNTDKTIEFATKIIKKNNDKKEVFRKFVESSSVNGLIYAPTQVGKSAATREFIETCFHHDVPVIVSTDNKLDQQEQLYYRIESDLYIADVVLLKAGDRSFKKTLEECIKKKFNRFIIFCLDNSSQIEKVIELFTSIYTRYKQVRHIKKLAIIHDEADIITKDKDINEIKTDQAISHQKWLELHNIINHSMPTIDLKRVFVTATPENCVMLYNIQCPDVMRLEIPNDYVGYNKIQHISIDDDKNLLEHLQTEVCRIHNSQTFEAILYCVERKIQNGQDKLLENLSTHLKCTVNTYNGNGITTYLKSDDLTSKFQDLLSENEISYTNKKNFFNIKVLSIRKFYSLIKKLGENCVITIGKDLICRGISYVGEDEINPLTATTMFYTPGKTMHNVGICQTIGRITGCAMPKLTRRVYCKKDVYDNYINYNKNQELYMQTIQTNTDNKITKDIIDDLIFEKTTRLIDRAKLNLSMTFKSDSELSDSESEEIIDGVKLTKIEDWLNNDTTIIGKILQYLYYNEEKISINELMETIEHNKTESEFRSYMDNACGIKCHYGKLWIIRNNNVTLNKKIRKYIVETFE